MSKETHSSTSRAGEPLCCCEYYNLKGEKSHVMASCCECEAVDEAFDKIFKCERIPNSTIDRMCDTISDRMRLPWVAGGAIKLRFDVVVPALTVPICLCVATLHPVLTVLTFLFMPLFIQLFHTLWRRRSTGPQETPFFYIWGLSSVISSYFVFQVFVVIFREVLLWEILLVFTMTATLFYLLHQVKKDPDLLRVDSKSRTTHKRTFSNSHLPFSQKAVPVYDQRSGDQLDANHQLFNKEASDVLNHAREVHRPDVPPRAGYCKICDCYIAVRDHHCVWLNSCIGASNHRSFLLAMILFIVTGAYGAHLTLTTVCTPRMYYDWFLLPNDCRWLYVDFLTAICFVTAVYSILATSLMCFGLMYQFLLISQNVTSHELATAYRQGRTTLLFWVRDNPNNHGFFRNWLEFWFLDTRTTSPRSLPA